MGQFNKATNMVIIGVHGKSRKNEEGVEKMNQMKCFSFDRIFPWKVFGTASDNGKLSKAL